MLLKPASAPLMPSAASEVHVILDMRTLFFEGSVICIAVSGIMVYYSMVRKTYPGFHHWTIGFSFGGLGSLFLAFRGSIPDFISIILANIFISIMPFMLSYGLSTLSGIKWKWRNFYITMLILFTIFMSYATYINPSIHIRITLFNTIFLILFIESLRITLRFLPKRLGGRNYLLIFVISANIIPVALRLTISIATGDDLLFIENKDSIQCISILATIVLTLITMISLIITNAQLIEIDLKEANKKVEMLANTDELTGLFNRRYFNKALKYEFKRLQRDTQPLSLIMADIDCFKDYNDTYGHQEGDKCLQSIAGIFKRSGTRVADIAARYGGEEFVILLPNTDKIGAEKVANTLLNLVRKLKIPHSASTAGDRVTISAGIATVIPSEKTSEDILINMADKALYTSKSHGKNQFTHYASGDYAILHTNGA
ncbi:diguanylate cyclase [Desulfolutivibrio sulfoxidireducens]|nr:diguanylate cyclase [Desulfolutivibrio sulfoxidireducens]